MQIPLGQNEKATTETESGQIQTEMTIEERIESLEDTLEILKNTISFIYRKICGTYNAYEEKIEKPTEETDKNLNKNSINVLNKDGIDVNTTFIGVSKNIPYVLCVHKEFYTVGNKQYNTLSAAAEGVSGVRRSGWDFWRDSINGKSLKELYHEKKTT